MQFAVSPTQGFCVHRVGCNYILLAMAAFGAFERAMLEAFRSLFRGRGYHSRLTFGAARMADRQKLWIRCFPHGHFSPTLETRIRAELRWPMTAGLTIRHPIVGTTQTAVPDYHV
jgi:hypothetical protein